MKKVIVLVAVIMTLTQVARADTCGVDDRACILKSLADSAAAIERPDWRDQTYRELAKTYAHDGAVDSAITVIAKINSPDTQALTIRGIGMAAADNNLPKEQHDSTFKKLRAAAETIKDPPSYAIALTYIAMAQAFAHDDEGAWATAAGMENASLRHKAYGETAEIQAERGDFAAVGKSIGFIDSPSYKDKAWRTVSKILADKKRLDEALKAANAVTNAYERAEALQYMLDAQKPRDIPHQ